MPNPLRSHHLQQPRAADALLRRRRFASCAYQRSVNLPRTVIHNQRTRTVANRSPFLFCCTGVSDLGLDRSSKGRDWTWTLTAAVAPETASLKTGDREATLSTVLEPAGSSSRTSLGIDDRSVSTAGPFVTVGRDASGVWWFQQGEKRFLSIGVSNLNDGGKDDGVGDVLGRECRAQQNSSSCGDTNNWDMTLNYSPYFNVTQALFNGSAKAWAADAAGRLKSWNFNTISGYSSAVAERAVAEHDMFYNRLLMFATRFAMPAGTPLEKSTAGGCFNSDVFSDEFVTSCDSYAKANVAPRANDTALLGWHFVSLPSKLLAVLFVAFRLNKLCCNRRRRKCSGNIWICGTG